MAFDPRQGTLLGFERPADAPTTLTAEQPVVEVEPAAPARIDRATRGKPAAVEKTEEGIGTGQGEQVAVVQAEQAEGLQLETPVAADQPAAFELAAAVEKAAVEKAVAEKAAAEKAAAEKAAAEKAAAEKVAAEKVAAEKAAAERVAAEKAAAEKAAAEKAAAEKATAEKAATAEKPSAPTAPTRTAGDTPRSLDAALPLDLAQTVASLQETLAQERAAAHERWRRTRHWLALASAGLVLLFVVSVAQTVALVGFAHRAQAAQQQTQSTLNGQQAALTDLASSTSALAARIEPLPVLSGSALDTSADANAAQRPAKHARQGHARHAAKDKSKPAAH